MRARLAVNLLLVTAFGGLLIGTGCAAAGTRPDAANAADPPEIDNHPQALSAATPLSLFGDNPDDEQVPFQSRLVTNLQQHTFTSDGLDFDPDIAPDGETLVFATTRNAEHPDIFLKNVQGSALTQLTGDPADDIQPRFSPDGRRVVFASNRAGNWDIWMINRDGTGLTQLSDDRTDEVAPCWTPDGTGIAYSLWGHGSRQWEIWTLAVDKPGVRRFLTFGMFPAWSPDGTRVAFQRARQRGSRWFSVWTIELDEGEARHPTEIAQSDTAACVAPCWAPDGTMIVFCAVRPESTPGSADMRGPSSAELWMVDLQTGLRMKLTDESAAAFNPVWGSQGRVFFVSARAGTENIWSLTADLVAYSPAPHDAAQAAGDGREPPSGK